MALIPGLTDAQRKTAAQDYVRSMIAPLRTELKGITATGDRQAQNAQDVYGALANIQQQQQGSIQQGYSQAAEQQNAFSKGYSDAVQQQQQQSVAAPNELLKSIGAPEGQQISPGNIGSLLYGTSGVIPSMSLSKQGAAQGAIQALNPIFARQAGIAQGDLIQSAAAQKYADSLASLNSKIPGLVQKQIADQEKAAKADEQRNLTNELANKKFALSSLSQAQQNSPYKVVIGKDGIPQVYIDPKTNKPVLTLAGSKYQNTLNQQDVTANQNSWSNAMRLSTAQSSQLGIVTMPQLDPRTGQWVPTMQTSKNGRPLLTVSAQAQQAELTAKLNKNQAAKAKVINAATIGVNNAKNGFVDSTKAPFFIGDDGKVIEKPDENNPSQGWSVPVVDSGGTILGYRNNHPPISRSKAFENALANNLPLSIVAPLIDQAQLREDPVTTEQAQQGLMGAEGIVPVPDYRSAKTTRTGRSSKHIRTTVSNNPSTLSVMQVGSDAGLTSPQQKVFAALVQQESRGHQLGPGGSTLVSPAGALGIGQLMPSTAKGLGVNPYDPSENLLGAATYFRQALDRYNGDLRLALASYNAGPGAVAKYNGVPPYRETQNYVKTILDAAGLNG